MTHKPGYNVQRVVRCFGGHTPQWSSYFGSHCIHYDSPTKGEAMRRNREHQAAHPRRCNVGSRYVPQWIFGVDDADLDRQAEEFAQRNNCRMVSYVREPND